MRENPPNPGLWGYTGTVWGVIMGADDSKTMQRIDARAINGEMILGAERPQMYGFTSVPVPPDNNGEKGAEVTIGFRGSDRAHPFVMSEGDRRTRPKNLKPGESKHHDDQGQYSHLARDGHVAVAKNHSITAGDKPDPGTHEINDQLKGLEARLSHVENSHHALFDVTSRMRMMVQGVVPSLVSLAPILSQSPTGLTAMVTAIAGTAPAYLQQHIEDAVAKFLSSPIAAVGSVMGGADGIIAALEAQIASVISANPVISTVDGLVSELAALNGSASPVVAAQMAPVIQGLIDSATESNPVIGQIANLRSQLSGLMTAAGPALSFLAPQQRIPQRLSRSLKLSQ
ncbi:MAG: phage baseplate assembly protein domain-containing protein [Janthinobacterium lividum]